MLAVSSRQTFASVKLLLLTASWQVAWHQKGNLDVMGKRLAKKELLQEIRLERGKLDDLLKQLTPRQMTRVGATMAGWSVKDILGHLIGWQKMDFVWLAAGKQGTVPELPAPGFTWKDIRALNEQIYRAHRRRSLNAVLADYASHHQQMLEMIDQVTDSELVTTGHFNWTGTTWTLSDYIRANTASHYRWASKHIRKFIKAQVKS